MTMALPPPNLHIPPSRTTISVRIIDTTSHISKIALDRFMSPPIAGFTHLSCPAFAFLIEHPSGRKLLFDLGVRADPENFSPVIKQRIESGGWGVEVQKGVREQLEEHGVNGADIEAVIWSHWHWDHLGDPSTFEPHTAVIVGPGFKSALLPGYPANASSPIRESDYAGRELRELVFDQNLKIGRFDALDYFGDGSFYILDSPGHAVGHLCAFARVTTDSFIFMGGDACHHGGEFRPSAYHPLPESISPNPLDAMRTQESVCPGALFEPILRDGDRTKPFYKIADPEDGSGVAYDVKEAEETIGKVIEADANDAVFVVMAHDDTLLDLVDFFPKYANEFKKKGWAEEGRWLFLKDFAVAVGV